MSITSKCFLLSSLVVIFVIRTLNIYPLSNILSLQYRAVHCRHYLVQISRFRSTCTTETLYPLTILSPFPLPWMNLKGIMVSELSKTQKDKYYRKPLI